MENLTNIASNLIDWGITSFHSNDRTIEQAKDCRSKGMRLCLFIGKTPSANDWNRDTPQGENEKWVTLSLEYPDIDYYFDSSKLHLVLDCDQSEQMKCINALFDKVIIDTSVTKFFDESAFINIVNTVAAAGTLIIPQLCGRSAPFGADLQINEIGYFTIASFSKDERVYYKQFKQFSHKFIEEILGKTILEGSYDEFVKANKQAILESDSYQSWESSGRYGVNLSIQPKRVKIHMFLEDSAKDVGLISPIEKNIAKSLERTKNELEQLFEKVEFCVDDSYWSWSTDYVIAKGRKPALSGS